MKISYNWLKNYLDFTQSPEELSVILTECGLEVEGIESFQSIKGGLEGLVVGEVITCVQHPNADRLRLTTVDVGAAELLQIVCGAPNVAAGQKVMVAPVGCTVHPLSGEPFKITKSKIRGEVSEGMICAEDEVSLGHSHDGILILDSAVKPGLAIKELFKVEQDYVFEIGLTPNRSDAASHIGVARDIMAVLYTRGLIQVNELKYPAAEPTLKPGNNAITVSVETPEACIRYSGLNIRGLKVAESPDWLKNRLSAIGIKPINNVVDVTNFVMMEYGQPLHAFDADTITGGKVLVQKLAEGTAFTTLDGEERKLSAQDLMICDAKRGLCIAGVYGGQNSGVNEKTRNIFLESACFDPGYVRSSSKRHNLKTDAAFRFERGTDPNATVVALKRAASLLLELCGGSAEGQLIDIYPKAIEPRVIVLSEKGLRKLTGVDFTKEQIEKSLTALGFKLKAAGEGLWEVSSPTYKVEVNVEADLVEEVLRIVGFAAVEVSETLSASLSYSAKVEPEQVLNKTADYLADRGFFEIMNTSLSSRKYQEWMPEVSEAVQVLNPLSSELDVLRTTMLFSGLESLQFNRNRQQADLKFFEFGYVYGKGEKGYTEAAIISLLACGRKVAEQWNAGKDIADIYLLKSTAENLLRKLGLGLGQVEELAADKAFGKGLSYILNGKQLLSIRTVNPKLAKQFDLSQEVVYGEIYWDTVLKALKNKNVLFTEISKFPSVRRDLSMTLAKELSYESIRSTAFAAEKSILKEMNIFDVYEGEKIAAGKKSYACSFILQDEQATLTDKQIEKCMERIMQQLESKLGAEIRKQ